MYLVRQTEDILLEFEAQPGVFSQQAAHAKTIAALQGLAVV
jgi:hypothetical protein